MGAAAAKPDPGDSYKLADYLRIDGHRLRCLDPVEPGLRELQALVRLRDDQIRVRSAAINQLTATLGAHWPGPRDLFQSLASAIALAFLTDYPAPQAAARLGEAVWPRSAAATPTAAASRQPNYWPGYALLPGCRPRP